MIIRITGAKQAPSWTQLEAIITESLGVDGQLTKISRDDGGHCYRDIGNYSLTFTPEQGDNVSIKFIVE